MRWWSIRITCPSQRSLLSLSMSSILCCPVLTLISSFVTLSFQEMPKMLLCHLWWAAWWATTTGQNCGRGKTLKTTQITEYMQKRSIRPIYGVFFVFFWRKEHKLSIPDQLKTVYKLFRSVTIWYSYHRESFMDHRVAAYLLKCRPGDILPSCLQTQIHAFTLVHSQGGPKVYPA